MFTVVCPTRAYPFCMSRTAYPSRFRLPFYPILLFLCLSLVCPSFLAVAQSSASPILLQGDIRSSQNQTYVQVPFSVPAGVKRLTLTFAYTGKDQHTTLDLGLMDPSGLRCWSGGNKSLLNLSVSDATPSCLPGPIPTGTWNLLIGVPNIRPGVASHYTAQVYLSTSSAVADQPSLLNQPLRTGPAWFRGDLHMHTAHSDGQCRSQTGKMVPCPVFFTVDAAARRGLDFIAITDHNETSQYDAMRELQPYFDKLLLIPGQEITTFHGHINVLGTTAAVDFRLGSAAVPDMNTLLRNAIHLGALVSINHPNLPSGEICLGCGWTPQTSVDMRLFSAVEAVNGGAEKYGISNIPFWNKQLDSGCRLTGIGGSDNHRPLQPLDQVGSVGSPTTVVYAAELSAPAILDAIRAGHAFIDAQGTRDRLIDVTAQLQNTMAHAGDLLSAPKGQNVGFQIHVSGASGGRLRWLEDSQQVASVPDSAIASADQIFPVSWTSDGLRHWFRAEVTDAEGKLWLLDNPVYINWETDNPCGVH